MAKLPEYYCRVCGLEQEQPTWSSLNEPSYLICPCCGVTFGVDDVRFTEVLERRNRWLDSGDWFQPQAKPTDWALIEQLGDLPEDWTLESLGVDPDETVGNVELQEKSKWSPEYADFYHFVAQKGLNGTLITDEHIDNFVNYFVEFCGYKAFYGAPELEVEPNEGFLPVHEAIFFLNPHAGFLRDRNGEPSTINMTVKDHADGVWLIGTSDYVSQFGFLDVRFVQSGRATSSELDSSPRSFLQYPASIPKAFRITGAFSFSKFLYFSPHMLSQITESSAGQKPSWGNPRNWFRRKTFHEEQLRYTEAIRELIRLYNDEGTSRNSELERARELQQFEKEKLRKVLENLKEQSQSYAATSQETFEQNKEHYLRRIASEGSSHFIAGEGYFFAYVPVERCQVLSNPDERNFTKLDGKTIAGVVNIPEYQEIICYENRQRRMLKATYADRLLLEEDFELVRNENDLQLFFKKRYWSYKPEMELQKAMTLPLDSTTEMIHAAKIRILQDSNLFAVCESCWNRKQWMEMHNSDLCSTCKGPTHGPDEQIVY